MEWKRGGEGFSCGLVLIFWVMSLGQSPCGRSRLTSTSYRPMLAAAMSNGEGGICQRQSCRTPSDPDFPLHIKSHQQQLCMGTVRDYELDCRDYPCVVQARIQQEMAARIYKLCRSHFDNIIWENKRWQLFEATSCYP